MNRTAISIAAILFSASAASAGQDEDFAHLAFLTGCWAGESDGEQIQESWSNQTGGSMLGTAKTVNGRYLKLFEFLRITSDDDGIQYVPYIKGVEAVPFALAVVGENHARFENPAHDFPKVIDYRRESDTLHISLNGDGGGFGFSMTSTPCR